MAVDVTWLQVHLSLVSCMTQIIWEDRNGTCGHTHILRSHGRKVSTDLQEVLVKDGFWWQSHQQRTAYIEIRIQRQSGFHKHTHVHIHNAPLISQHKELLPFPYTMFQFKCKCFRFRYTALNIHNLKSNVKVEFSWLPVLSAKIHL